MNILFIHGRAQEQFSQDELLQTWSESLMKSFENADITYPLTLSLTLPYYGSELIMQKDLYEKDIKAGKFQMRSPKQVDNLAEFNSEFLEEMRKNAGISKKQVMLEEGEETASDQYRGILNWGSTLAVVSLLDKTRFIGNWSIMKATADVATYLIVPNAAKKLNSLFLSAIGDDPTIIIAHSLGTIIAYNVLLALKADKSNIKGLITLGSPLGVQAVKRQLYPAPSYPISLKGAWVNIYDDNDIVSLHPLIDKYFRVSPSIVNYKIENTSSDRHHIAPYLSSPLVALRIMEMMNS
jgi:hypothetical protein